MNARLCFSALLFLASTALAQTATIKDIPADGESTTITVEKNKSKAKASDEILEGSAEIAGDPQILEKAARASWKKACEDWKKEVKELNKANDVLILNCNPGQIQCDKEGVQITCKSTAVYKIRLKLVN